MIKALFQKIVVAYNGSPSSLHAVMYAIMMARLYKCQVKIVYVVDTETIKKLILTKFMIREEGDALSGGLEADGRRNLAYAAGLAKAKGIKVETELRSGSVWAEVIAAADEYKADLILLGGHGEDRQRSTLHHDVVSMQDSEIIGSAHCSVMVVRHEYMEQLFKLA